LPLHHSPPPTPLAPIAPDLHKGHAPPHSPPPPPDWPPAPALICMQRLSQQLIGHRGWHGGGATGGIPAADWLSQGP
ncbi:unnamed protein product, partial [Bubo scandiacus]